jgi:magnesium-transporting ATPase (P-type)
MANVYFAIIAFLSLFPSLSPITPLSAISPFVFVVMVSVVREGFEDLSRYKSDKEVNSQQVAVLRQDETIDDKVSSEKLRVGDLIHVRDGERLAADVIVLQSSNEGQAFIQTSSLDGEKNLKKRQAPKGFRLENSGPNSIYKVKGQCDCDPPNAELYKFNGILNYQQENYTLTENQLLLKGSVLKNTEWVNGFVVYSGK